MPKHSLRAAATTVLLAFAALLPAATAAADGVQMPPPSMAGVNDWNCKPSAFRSDPAGASELLHPIKVMLRAYHAQEGKPESSR